MSMLSSQIDELRKWADQLSERENEFGVVVRALVAALRDAADTIWQLRDDLQRANAENAKLRELAAILCHCMQIKASCDDCRISGRKGELARDPLAACDGLHEMLRELGVEA